MRRRNVVFIALCLFAITGMAKTLYKYQDAQGNWHYTDKQPLAGEKLEARQLVETRRLTPATQQRVWLEKTGDNESQDFFVINKYPGPIEMEVSWSKQENVQAIPDLPKRFVLGAGQSPPLFKIRQAARGLAASFGLQQRYVIGPPLLNYASEVLICAADTGQHAISNHAGLRRSIQPYRCAKPLCGRYQHAGRYRSICRARRHCAGSRGRLFPERRRAIFSLQSQ